MNRCRRNPGEKQPTSESAEGANEYAKQLLACIRRCGRASCSGIANYIIGSLNPVTLSAVVAAFMAIRNSAWSKLPKTSQTRYLPHLPKIIWLFARRENQKPWLKLLHELPKISFEYTYARDVPMASRCPQSYSLTNRPYVLRNLLPLMLNH